MCCHRSRLNFPTTSYDLEQLAKEAGAIADGTARVSFFAHPGLGFSSPDPAPESTAEGFYEGQAKKPTRHPVGCLLPPENSPNGGPEPATFAPSPAAGAANAAHVSLEQRTRPRRSGSAVVKRESFLDVESDDSEEVAERQRRTVPGWAVAG